MSLVPEKEVGNVPFILPDGTVDVPGMIANHVAVRKELERTTFSWSVDVAAFEPLPNDLFDGAARMDLSVAKPIATLEEILTLTDDQKARLRELGGTAAEQIIETMDESLREAALGVFESFQFDE